ncbi:MAG: hypothetical protein JO072_13120 [Parafilimonas sp.]|nr:hypothetical protein [Parafilimonas sp.]
MKSTFITKAYTVRKLFLVCTVLISFAAAAQRAEDFKPGALLLSKDQYAKLPKVNWDTLRKYAMPQNKQKIAGAGGITLLINPPIGNQGGEGSCVGWATGYSAMGILTYSKFNCWANAERSPNYVYNQIKISNDCLSGSYITSGLNLVQTQGDCSWNLMPYVDGDCITQPTQAQRNDAGNNKALRWATLAKNDVTGMKNALDLGYPVVIGFLVTQSFDAMWNTNGIWNTNTGTNRGAHATCIVGYDNNRGMFKVQNQWGNGGDNGYFWVTYSLVAANCLGEAYVLYGVTPTLQMSISGQDAFCTTSAQYSVTNLPANNTVVWSASPSGAVTIATANNKATLTKAYDAHITLTASVRNTCNNILPDVIKPNITVGNPLPLPITWSTSYGGGTSKYLSASCALLPNTTSANYVWTLTPTKAGLPVTTINGSSFSNFSMPACSGLAFKVTITTPCGVVSDGATTWNELGCGPNVTVSPNPAANIINIALAGNAEKIHGIQKVEITNKLGTIVKQQNFENKKVALKLDVSTLLPGEYVARVYDGVNWNTAKFIITR